MLSVALAALTLTYASYSWFVLTGKVTANDLKLAVTASDSFDISFDGTNWSQTVSFNSTDYVAAGNKFGPINPMSSVTGFDGKTFFTNAAGLNGVSNNNTIFHNTSDVTTDKGMFRNTEGEWEGYYLDVDLYFRTVMDGTNCETNNDGNINLYLTRSGGTGSDITSPDGSALYKTARTAFLKENAGDGNKLTKNAADGAGPLVFASPDASCPNAVINSGSGADKKSLTDYIQLSGDDAVSAAPVVTIAPGDYSDGFSYRVTKITLRVWIEGEDNACVSGLGNKSFNINLAFSTKDI